jgi:gas vesicle protein
VIIERVVEKTMAGIIYPMLMHTNYTEWSALMCMNLQAARLWEAVRYGAWSTAMTDMLWRPCCTLCRQTCLTNKETAYDAWESIQMIQVGVDRVKEANAERLRQEFTEIRF